MLRKAETTLFFKNYASAGYKCWIPEVCVKEIIVNYRDQLHQKIENFNGAVNKINRQSITIYQEKLSGEALQSEVEKFESHLRGALDLYNVSIKEYPKISHELILNQLFERKFPFDKKDSGYKDFLIFHNCLEIIKETKSDLILVTKDQDFGISDLHSDLKSLINNKYEIKIRDSIKGINDAELKETIQNYILKFEFNQDLFKDDDHVSQYMDAVIDNLKSMNYKVPIEVLLEDFELYKDPIMINISLDESSWDFNQAKPIDENNLLIMFSIYAYLVYSITIFKFEQSQLSDLPHDAQIILTSEKNDTLTFTVSSHHYLYFEVISDINGTDITEVEIVSIG